MIFSLFGSRCFSISGSSRSIALGYGLVPSSVFGKLENSALVTSDTDRIFGCETEFTLPGLQEFETWSLRAGNLSILSRAGQCCWGHHDDHDNSDLSSHGFTIQWSRQIHPSIVTVDRAMFGEPRGPFWAGGRFPGRELREGLPVKDPNDGRDRAMWRPGGESMPIRGNTEGKGLVTLRNIQQGAQCGTPEVEPDPALWG